MIFLGEKILYFLKFCFKVPSNMMVKGGYSVRSLGCPIRPARLPVSAASRPSLSGVFARSVTRAALRRRLPHSYFATTLRAKGGPSFRISKIARRCSPPLLLLLLLLLILLLLLVATTFIVVSWPPCRPGDLAKKPQSRVTA